MRHTDRVVLAKFKSQSICLILVKWILIQYSDVHLPFLKVVGFHKLETRGQMLLCLCRMRER